MLHQLYCAIPSIVSAGLLHDAYHVVPSFSYRVLPITAEFSVHFFQVLTIHKLSSFELRPIVALSGLSYHVEVALLFSYEL